MTRTNEYRLARLETAIAPTARLRPIFVIGDEDAEVGRAAMIRSGAANEGDEFFVFRTIYEDRPAAGDRR